MKIININKNDFRNAIQIGVGTFGTCYLINGLVYKIIDKEYIGMNPDFEKNMIFLSQFKNDTYIFPQDLLTIDDVICGYTMEYFAGINYRGEKDIDLKNLLAIIEKVENDTYSLCIDRIITNDVYYNNILFDGEKIKIIDPDQYYKANETIDLDTIVATNLKTFNEEMFTDILGGYIVHQTLVHYPDYIKEAYYKVLNGKMFLSEFLKQFIMETEEILGTSINKVEDVHRLSLYYHS